jgi:hypothetical protein
MAALDGLVGVRERELVFVGPTGCGEFDGECFQPGACLEQVAYLVEADRGDQLSDPGVAYEATLADEPFQCLMGRRSADCEVASERVRREHVSRPRLPEQDARLHIGVDAVGLADARGRAHGRFAVFDWSLFRW